MRTECTGTQSFNAKSFYLSASLASPLHVFTSNIFQLYFLPCLALSLSSSQQPPVHPTTSPSSVHRASTSPPLRAKPPFGQVLSTYPFLSPAASVVFSRHISCNYIISLCTSTSLLLLCGTLFINKNTAVLLRMTFPH